MFCYGVWHSTVINIHLIHQPAALRRLCRLIILVIKARLSWGSAGEMALTCRQDKFMIVISCIVYAVAHVHWIDRSDSHLNIIVMMRYVHLFTSTLVLSSILSKRAFCCWISSLMSCCWKTQPHQYSESATTFMCSCSWQCTEVNSHFSLIFIGGLTACIGWYWTGARLAFLFFLFYTIHLARTFCSIISFWRCSNNLALDWRGDCSVSQQ